MATGIDRRRDYRERSISAELRIRPTMPRVRFGWSANLYGGRDAQAACGDRFSK
jgi:hypothetical protein